MPPVAEHPPLPTACLLTGAAYGATSLQRAALILACGCEGCRTARIIAGIHFFASTSVAGLARQEN